MFGWLKYGVMSQTTCVQVLALPLRSYVMSDKLPIFSAYDKVRVIIDPLSRVVED